MLYTGVAIRLLLPAKEQMKSLVVTTFLRRQKSGDFWRDIQARKDGPSLSASFICIYSAIRGSNVRCNHFLPKALIKLMIRSFHILSGGTVPAESRRSSRRSWPGPLDYTMAIRRAGKVCRKLIRRRMIFHERSTWRWQFS